MYKVSGLQQLIILYPAAHSRLMENAAVHKALKIQGLSTSRIPSKRKCAAWGKILELPELIVCKIFYLILYGLSFRFFSFIFCGL